MIDSPISMFNKYSFSKAIQNKFYGRILEYMDYVLPVLIQGKHTIKNEMECVASQYLHLYYVPTKDPNYNFIVYRYEQGPDLVFINDKRFDSHSVTVLNGAEELSEKIEQGYLKKNRKGEFVFETIKDLQSFIQENRNSLLKEEATTSEILKGQQDTFIFTVSNRYKDVGTPIQVESHHAYTFEDQLKVFGMCNSLLCGVSEEKGEEIPDIFLKDMDDVSKMMDKLKKQLPKEKE